MADLTRTIEIIFGAVDNVSGSVRSMVTELDKFDSTIQGIASPIADVSKTIVTLDAAVLALSATLGVKAVQAAGDFYGKINEIGSISGQSADQLKTFSGQVLDYSINSTQSIDKINGAIYSAVSAGVDWNNSLELLTVTEKLAVAGQADLQQSTLTVVSALNAYGASTDQAQAYADTLFQTVKIGQTTLPELSASLGQVTGIAANAGISFDTLGAAIAALTSSGIGTSEAITGIKAAISNIINPSSEAEKAAAALGIQFDAATLKSKGFDGILKDVYTTTGGNISELTKLFGSVEALNAVLVLGADKSGTFAKALQAMQDKTGSVDEAFKIMQGNLSNVLQQLENGLNAVFVTAGQKMLDDAVDIKDGLSAVFQGFKVALDAGSFDPVFDALDSFSSNAREYLRQVGEALPEALSQIDWRPLLDSFDNLGGSVRDTLQAVFDGVDLTTPQGLADAIQRLVDVFTSLNNFTAGFVEGIRPLLDAVAEFAERAREGGSEAETMGGKVGAAAVALVELGTKFGAVLIALGEFSNGVDTASRVVIEVFVGAWNIASGTIKSIVAGIIELLGTLADTFGDLIPGDDPFDRLAVSYKAMAAEIRQSANTDFAEAQQAAESMVNAIDNINGSTDTAKQSVFDFGRNVSDAGKGLDEWGVKADEAATAQSDLAKEIDAASQFAIQGARSMEEVNQILDSIYGTTTKVSDGFATYTDALNALTASHKQGMIVMQDGRYVIDDFYNSTEAVTAATEKSTEATKTGSEEWKRVQDVLTNNTKVANDYKLKLEELSLKKYEIDVQARVDMNIADLEAQTARFQASLDSTVAMAQSSADIISSALSTLSSINEWFEPQKFALVKQVIEAELDNRRREIDLQEQLINKQMEYLSAKAARLNSGDALIKIDGGQLQTELQLVFDKILKFTQVKATEDGLALLLGV